MEPRLRVQWTGAEGSEALSCGSWIQGQGWRRQRTSWDWTLLAYVSCGGGPSWWSAPSSRQSTLVLRVVSLVGGGVSFAQFCRILSDGLRSLFQYCHRNHVLVATTQGKEWSGESLIHSSHRPLPPPAPKLTSQVLTGKMVSRNRTSRSWARTALCTVGLIAVGIL